MRISTDYIVVHCAATKPSMDIGATEIDRWHRERGFRKIGYQFVIRRDGTVETGRALEEVGAHAEGFNSRSVGICLVGGLSQDGKSAENNFTEAQFRTLRALLDDLKGHYPFAEVLGHRDLPNVKKDCPSFDVRKWLAEQG